MTDSADVPLEVIHRLAAICLELPEAYEELAWVGLRWRIRKRTFAHVLTVDDGRPPAYASAVGTDGPVNVLIFRSPDGEVDALSSSGHPFFKPRWGSNVLGMVLDEDVDWDDVTELLTQSYVVQAPRKLAVLVAGTR